MNQIKVVVFDCDGVMFDTKKANTAFYNQILKAMGKPLLNSEQFEYVHMHTVNGALSFLFDDEKTLIKAHEYRKKMGYHPFIREMLEEPGLKPLLNQLRPRYKTAVATNRSDTMESVLNTFALETCFDLVITALDVNHPKPHPDVLVKVLTRFDVKSHEAVYIGDSVLDEQAAGAAKIPFIAYQNPLLKAKHHISSLSEINRILGF